MNLALNILRRLIYHETQPTNQPTNRNILTKIIKTKFTRLKICTCSVTLSNFKISNNHRSIKDKIAPSSVRNESTSLASKVKQKLRLKKRRLCNWFSKNIDGYKDVMNG